MLENDTSRQELIDQLRKVAATPPQDPVPAIAPPEAEEEKTVLENVTDISRRYGEALSSRFAQLYRNLVGTSHKPFNPHTFPQPPPSLLLWLAPSSFFTGCCACLSGRFTGKWASGDAKRISIKAAGCIFRQ